MRGLALLLSLLALSQLLLAGGLALVRQPIAPYFILLNRQKTDDRRDIVLITSEGWLARVVLDDPPLTMTRDLVGPETLWMVTARSAQHGYYLLTLDVMDEDPSPQTLVYPLNFISGGSGFMDCTFAKPYFVPSPASQIIAVIEQDYGSPTRSESERLLLVDSQGERVRPLTGDLRGIITFRWSPDGDWLVLAWYDEESRIYTDRVDPATGRRERVAAMGLLPVFSPAGEVAFWRGEDCRFYQLSPAGPQRLAVSEEHELRAMAWLPDGRLLVEKLLPGFRNQLHFLDLDANELTPVMPGTEWNGWRGLSPDGQWVYLVDREDSSLYRVRVDGGPPQHLLHIGSRFDQGAPLYQVNAGRDLVILADPGDGPAAIYRLSTHDSLRQALFKVQPGMDLMAYRLTPDKRALLVTSVVRMAESNQFRSQVYHVRLHDGATTRLPDGDFYGFVDWEQGDWNGCPVAGLAGLLLVGAVGLAMWGRAA
jgi:Tol biopolymer transport system component